MSTPTGGGEELEGCGRLRDLALGSALQPNRPHLLSLRRRLAALAGRLPPEAAPPPERSIAPGA